jgi:hypothetical protein
MRNNRNKRFVSDSAETSFGSSFGCFESKLVSALSETKRLFQLFRFQFRLFRIETSFEGHPSWGRRAAYWPPAGRRPGPGRPSGGRPQRSRHRRGQAGAAMPQ